MTLEYMSSSLYPLMAPEEIISNYKIVLRHTMPIEWQQIVLDMSNSNISNVETRIKVYHLITFTMQGERRIGGYGSTLCEIIYLSMHSCISISFLSFVDPIHFKDQIYAETVKSSDLTEYELFIYSPPQVVMNILVAFKVHLEMKQLVESGQVTGVSLQDYYKVAAKNFRAINILRKKYRVIDAQHLDIVKKLEEINNDEHPQQQTVEMSVDDKLRRLEDFESQLSSVMQKFINLLPFKEKPQRESEEITSSHETDGLQFFTDMFMLDDTSDLFLEF